MKQEKFYLSGKEALALRGLGHHLKPTAMVGKEGVTPAVLEALEAVLAVHELIKVKVQEGCPLEREAAAEQLAAGSKAKIAQIIGRMILLYRPKPPEKAAPATRNLKPGRPPRRSGKAGAGSGRGKGGSTTGMRGKGGGATGTRGKGGSATGTRSKGGSATETRGKGGGATGTRGRKAAAPRGGRPVAGTAGKASARRQQGRASGKR